MKAPFTKIYGMLSGLPFPEIRNIRKAFFYKNIRNFLILEVESSIFQNIRKYKNFFRVDFRNIRKDVFEKIQEIFSW